MTYDEAVKLLSSHVGPWDALLTDSEAREVLDAIGYRQMQERIDSFEVDGAIDRRYIEKVRDERDAARTLADQLAKTLIASMPNGSAMVYAALDIWSMRDWRPISPPGSGLDGLLTDINRED